MIRFFRKLNLGTVNNRHLSAKPLLSTYQAETYESAAVKHRIRSSLGLCSTPINHHEGVTSSGRPLRIEPKTCELKGSLETVWIYEPVTFLRKSKNAFFRGVLMPQLIGGH